MRYALVIVVGVLIAACGGTGFSAGGAGDAGSDATSHDGAGSSSSSGSSGDGSVTVEASPDAPGGTDASGVDATDAPADVAAEASPTCLTDLSNVGTGDFHVSFTLTTTAGSVDMALLNQRTGCDETSTWWDVSYIPSTSTQGSIQVATDDGTHYVVAEQSSGFHPDDGKPHHIVASRVAGLLQFTIDDVLSAGPVADAYAFGAMSPLRVGTDDCPGFEATVGTITDVCLTRP